MLSPGLTKEDSHMILSRESKQKYWKGLVEEWEFGDETQNVFCERKGISYASFTKWRHRFKKSSEHGDGDVQNFIEAKMNDDSDMQCDFRLTLSSGISLTVPTNCTTSQLTKLFSALGLLK